MKFVIFAALIAGIYGQERCDHLDQYYWQEEITTDQKGNDVVRCRYIYCAKMENTDTGEVYGIIENGAQYLDTMSESEIRNECNLDCKQEQFVDADTCGCPSCAVVPSTTMMDMVTTAKSDGFTRCDQYDQWYWEEEISTDNLGQDVVRCRYIYCMKVQDSHTGEVYGIIENGEQYLDTMSEADIQHNCGLKCTQDQFIESRTCGCPSCPLDQPKSTMMDMGTTYGCNLDDTVQCADDPHVSIPRNAHCEFELDKCCRADGDCVGYGYLNEQGLVACKYDCGSDKSTEEPYTTPVGGCPDDVKECEDGTYISRDPDTCKFDLNDCCIMECGDDIHGWYKLYGHGYEMDSGVIGCRYEKDCDGSYTMKTTEMGSTIACDEEKRECPEGTDQDVYYADDSCEFDVDDCCMMKCEHGDIGVINYGVAIVDDTTGKAECRYEKTCDELIKEEMSNLDDMMSTTDDGSSPSNYFNEDGAAEYGFVVGIVLIVVMYVFV